MDMYTRVKRERRTIKRDMYGIPLPEEEEQKTEGEGESQSGDESTEETEEEEEEEPEKRVYCLREHKPRVNLYEAAPIGKFGSVAVCHKSWQFQFSVSFIFFLIFIYFKLITNSSCIKWDFRLY